jgi:hypothetical protein
MERPGKPPRATTAASENVRHFMLKKPTETTRRVAWLNRTTVYEGTLISMTARVVRLFAPDPSDARPHVDLSYDWVTPVR